MIPFSARFVMQCRKEPDDRLGYFSTPPWATHAFVNQMISDRINRGHVAWDPACGEGHMDCPQLEKFDTILASDIFDYGLCAKLDFMASESEQVETESPPARERNPGPAHLSMAYSTFRAADQDLGARPAARRQVLR